MGREYFFLGEESFSGGEKLQGIPPTLYETLPIIYAEIHVLQ